MDIDTYFNKIADSSPEDWFNIGPQPYLADIHQFSGGGETRPWLQMEKAMALFVLSTDISISVAHGRVHEENFQEDWVPKSGARKASSGWNDFLYNGALVYSDLYVAVDGGRCCLPVPGPTSMEVPSLKFDVWNVLNRVSGSVEEDYGMYFRRIGGKINDNPWPLNRE